MDLDKYESLINDLNSLESQIEILKNKYSDTLERSNEIEVSLNESQEEGELLQNKIAELEGDLIQIKKKSENIAVKSLTLEERDTLKRKIKELISRIDVHLSA